MNASSTQYKTTSSSCESTTHNTTLHSYHKIKSMTITTGSAWQYQIPSRTSRIIYSSGMETPRCLKPPALQYKTLVIHTSYNLRQTDGRSCAMHMILTSLSAIYQSHVPILQSSKRHADRLSRMHIRYILTGKMTPWIDRPITFISDSLRNDHSKS